MTIFKTGLQTIYSPARTSSGSSLVSYTLLDISAIVSKASSHVLCQAAGGSIYVESDFQASLETLTKLLRWLGHFRTRQLSPNVSCGIVTASEIIVLSEGKPLFHCRFLCRWMMLPSPYITVEVVLSRWWAETLVSYSQTYVFCSDCVLSCASIWLLYLETQICGVL